MSGSSGSLYGVRLLEVLHKADDVETHLVVSKWARTNIEHETDHTLEYVQGLATKSYDADDLGAAVSSGSFRVDGMIVAPCSVRTLSAIANSNNDNLLVRAADVQLKERRRLVLLFRETPLNRNHIRLMLDVTDAGAVVMPPVPTMYSRPKSVDDIVNHTVQRALDQFHIERKLLNRWTGIPEESRGTG
jgi:4-hydroxy-3-polyprenylbenzoate decarboxylase